MTTKKLQDLRTNYDFASLRAKRSNRQKLWDCFPTRGSGRNDAAGACVSPKIKKIDLFLLFILYRLIVPCL